MVSPTRIEAATTAAMPPRANPWRPLAFLGFTFAQERMVAVLRRRHGDAFAVRIPLFGDCVIVSSPDLVRQVFQGRDDELDFGATSPLGAVLGPGSLFALDGERHLAERRLILPAFHGERMQAYAAIIAQEADVEFDSWQSGHEFASLPAFMRITLRSILRAVFGAGGADVAELERLLPAIVTLGSRLSFLPQLQRDLGPGSPGRRFRSLRSRYDAVIDRMVDAARSDPRLADRDDVMSMLLRAHYEDGSQMSRAAIADELLTLLAAGHETTATTLAWAVERLRRNPGALERLTAEARAGGREYRLATIHEVQRTRPVIVATSRHVISAFRLGPWTIEPGYELVVSANAIHHDERFFADAHRFEPQRFIDQRPDTYTWIPFGGGTRRCIGAAFAEMEMDVVLQRLLDRFDLATTDARAERWRNRGIAYAPARGGRVVVYAADAAPSGGVRSYGP